MANTLVQRQQESRIRPFFDDFFTSDPFRALTSIRPEVFAGYNLPAMDLYSKDGSYVVELAAPGYEKKDIDIDIDGNCLTVTGKYTKEAEETAKEKRYHYRELRKGNFSRSVTLPENIDASKVSATFEGGMLKVEIPTQRRSEAKKVTIK